MIFLHDVIVIGRGPSGLTASIYTSRANLDTLVIGKRDSRLIYATKIENYFGFPDAIKGEQLLKQGEEQAIKFGVKIIDDEVISISKNDQNNYFEIETSKETFQCKALLIATGYSQKKPKIENLKEFEGKGINYCSSCDGFFYRNRKVGILGSKDFAMSEALELEALTKDITLYTNGKKFELSDSNNEKKDKFKINNKVIKKIEGNEFLEKIIFEDESTEDIDGLFIAEDSASGIDFARKLGLIVDGDYIVVDNNQKTNIEGIFAAGDCTGGFKQVSTAVAQGAIAAKKISEYVRETKNTVSENDKEK